MKLMLTKNQAKGMLGATSFEVKAQVDITPEEQKLIQHYGLQGAVLFSKKVTFFGKTTDKDIEVRVRDLLDGEGFRCKDLEEVIAYSESIKSACSTLKSYLDVAATFGGQEVFEIN
jgi:hypothetical protein